MKDTETVTQITNQIIYGNMTAISSSGDKAQFNINIAKGDRDAFARALINAGIPKTDASELSEIVASEKGGNSDEPFGAKAKAWIAKNVRKAADGTWKVGIAVATRVMTEAVLK